MKYIAINPKTIINISPQKYGWKHLQSEEALATLPKTTIYINHSDEIIQLAKMITSTHDMYHTVTTTDNSAFIKRFYQLVRDNLYLANCPEELDLNDIKTFHFETINLEGNPAIKALAFCCYYVDLEAALRTQLTRSDPQLKDRPILSKEELETPLTMDDYHISSHPLIDDTFYYLSPNSLRYITYIYASIIYQFVNGK